MLKPSGSGDDRCLGCKTLHCFVCEHKKTDDELTAEINMNLNADKELNPLFLISSNLSSLNNDPRCLTCRIQHCFQVSFTLLTYRSTNSFCFTLLLN